MPGTCLRLAVPLLALVLAACGGGGGVGVMPCGDGAGDVQAAPVIEGDGAVVFLNDEVLLDAQVACRNEAIPIDAVSEVQALGKTGADEGATPAHTDLSLRLVAEARPPVLIGLPAFSGQGPDDLSAGGAFDGVVPRTFRVEIDGAGEPDSFRWSDDGGVTWRAEGVPVTGVTQPLELGVTVAFSATSGHVPGDDWEFTAGPLQATSVSMKGGKAFVSYAMAGAPHLGAISIYNMNTGVPKLKSQVLFRDTDVNAVTTSANFVYGTGASNPGAFPDPAVLDRIRLDGLKMVPDDYARRGLPSFAGTSVTSGDDGRVYATSGDGGGLTVFDPVPFAEAAFAPLFDTRWVTTYGNRAVVAQGGTPGGALSVFDLSASVPDLMAVWPFDGADLPEGKTTVEVAGGKAFVAAGRSGVQVLGLDTGDLLATVPVPDAPGVDPADRTANAAAVDDDLLFVAFGGAGLYVARGAEDFDLSPADAPLDLTVVGRLRLGDYASVNHVAYKGGALFIASGLGGLKIVRVDRGGPGS